MPKLSDTQAILLVGASQRDNRSLLPFPVTLVSGEIRTGKAIAGLIQRGLVEQRPTTDATAVYRADGDSRVGAFITGAGLIAINAADEHEGSADQRTADRFTPAHAAIPAALGRITKSGMVLTLLRRDDGATLAELIEATGWLPHTIRAALTGLRKKGHAITRGQRGETTCYHAARA